jgi:hypothetical protein
MEHGVSKDMTNNRNSNGDGHRTDIITNTSPKTQDRNREWEMEKQMKEMSKYNLMLSGYIRICRIVSGLG